MKEYESLVQAIEELYGGGTSVAGKRAVAGGDINQAFELKLSNGETLFMKVNSKKNIDFFRAEAEGLRAIKATNTVNVPECLASGTDGTRSFLLMKHIEEGRKSRDSSEKLGRALANMHMADASAFVANGRFGFLHDNFIGAGIQKNDAKENWLEFFIQCRLLPQYEMASGWFGKEEHQRFDILIQKLDRYLQEPLKPSLLHGDLWAGNYMIDHAGAPWLIDPAAYVGHREADLAMTELFGGFDQFFYGAYNEAVGIDAGYKDRRDLYNMYHLMNHLNFFGGGYLSSVKGIINRYS